MQLMKIVFVSNFINHHQIGVADELWELTNHNYFFISNTPMPESFIKNGYSTELEKRPYLLKAYLNKESFEKSIKLACEADLMIIGSAPLIYEIERAKLGKLTFEYSERALKKGLLNLLSPRLLKHQFYYHTNFYNKPIYKLCASAYTVNDMYFLRSFRNKCYKWGYFTNIEKLDIEAIIKNKRNKKISLLWCARLLNWKHPELAIFLAKKLKESGYSFILNMIGSGDKYDSIKKMIINFDLKNEVKLLGNYPNDEVLKIMRNNHIFLFTSDKNEGWGAVLNEAMSNGCCPVASHMIGAAPYLIKHNNNGMLFQSQNIDSLYLNVKYLIDNPNERERMTKEAYDTILNQWSPYLAARNIIKLTDILINNIYNDIIDGPCSDACPTKIINLL